MNKEELLKMAREAGISIAHSGDTIICDGVELLSFSNSILERAAVECETLPFGSDNERHVSHEITRAIRALKTNNV